MSTDIDTTGSGCAAINRESVLPFDNAPLVWKHADFVQVIGLRGVAGAGKTTIRSLVGEALWKHPRIQTIYAGFADPIRIGLQSMGINKSDRPEDYRHLAQLIGQRMRDSDPDFWVRQALWSIQVHVENSPKPPASKSLVVMLFDDVRYPNEQEICDATFYITPTFKPRPTGGCPKHESERFNQEVLQQCLEPGYYPNPAGFSVIQNPEGFGFLAANRILHHVQRAYQDFATRHSGTA